MILPVSATLSAIIIMIPMTLPAACLIKMLLLPESPVMLLMDISPIRFSRITETVRTGSILAILLIFPDIELLFFVFIS